MRPQHLMRSSLCSESKIDISRYYNNGVRRGYANIIVFLSANAVHTIIIIINIYLYVFYDLVR